MGYTGAGAAYDSLWDLEVLRNVTIQRMAEGLKEIDRLYQARRYGDAWNLAYDLEQSLREVAHLTGDAEMVEDADRGRAVEPIAVEDYESESGRVTIWGGKGHKDRTVYIAGGAQDAMDDWLEVRGREPGPLFVPVHQSGRIRIERMTAQAAYYILTSRAGEAGIEEATPHDMRRTAISRLIEAKGLATAQKVAGHSDPKTTARYDRRGEQVKQEAASAVDVPYGGRW